MLSHQRHYLNIGVGALLLASFYSQADYYAQIENPSDGFIFSPSVGHSFSYKPIIGSDGREYYGLGVYFPVSAAPGGNALPGYGKVKCVGEKYSSGSWYNYPASDAWHRLFIAAAPANAKINGLAAYKVADGVFVTISGNTVDRWMKIEDASCAYISWDSQSYQIQNFPNAFPFDVNLYIDRKIIDGSVNIPQTDLAGYVIAYGSGAPPANFIPINKSSIPFRMRTTQINVNTYCTTTVSSGMPGKLELRHGSLNTMEYDSQASGQVTYDCHFSSNTPVNLKLQYTTDDAQKRLPLLNSSTQDKVYSELTMIDEATGMSGTNLNVNIETLKTITVRSHLKGQNASAGNYHGSAILIATMK